MIEKTDITFRPMEETDLPFLKELYASTRQEELEVTGWPQDEIDSFLLMQFQAQHTHYTSHFRDADFDIILSEAGEPIGRLYLDERKDEFRIIDIALLPEWRGRGIGGEILRELISRAQSADKAVRIHVEYNNPALRLYQRLGFAPVSEEGVYLLMERLPDRLAHSA